MLRNVATFYCLPTLYLKQACNTANWASNSPFVIFTTIRQNRECNCLQTRFFIVDKSGYEVVLGDMHVTNWPVLGEVEMG